MHIDRHCSISSNIFLFTRQTGTSIFRLFLCEIFSSPSVQSHSWRASRKDFASPYKIFFHLRRVYKLSPCVILIRWGIHAEWKPLLLLMLRWFARTKQQRRHGRSRRIRRCGQTQGCVLFERVVRIGITRWRYRTASSSTIQEEIAWKYSRHGGK